MNKAYWQIRIPKPSSKVIAYMSAIIIIMISPEIGLLLGKGCVNLQNEESQQSPITITETEPITIYTSDNDTMINDKGDEVSESLGLNFTAIKRSIQAGFFISSAGQLEFALENGHSMNTRVLDLLATITPKEILDTTCDIEFACDNKKSFDDWKTDVYNSLIKWQRWKNSCPSNNDN